MWHALAEENCIDFSSGKLKKMEHLEDFGVPESIILKKLLKEIGWKGLSWNGLTQHKDKSRAGTP
jgi:hypothetical protein